MAITNASLAQKINDLLDKWTNREEEMQSWISGAAGGGDFSNGTYPLTDPLGNVLYTKSPAQLEADVSGLVDSASAYADAADQSATAAAASESAAQSAQGLAETARDGAELAESNAQQSESAAQNAEVNALAHRDNALAARDKAEKWAEEAYQTEVETGKYSAKHWATVAEGFAGSVDSGLYYQSTEVDALLAGKSDTGHTHSYLPLSGGTVTGNLHVQYPVTGTPGYNNNTLELYAPGAAAGEKLVLSFHLGSVNAAQLYYEVDDPNEIVSDKTLHSLNKLIADNEVVSGDLDLSGDAYVHGNISIDGTGWAIFPNRVGVGGTGVPNKSGAVIQADGDIHLDGALGFFDPTNTAQNTIYASGSPYEYMKVRNYSSEATLWEVLAKSGDPTVDDREATLALTRQGDGTGNSEFIDLFNNGYHGNVEDWSVAYGLRIQKRGTGEYRKFLFDWYDGTTQTKGYEALSPDDAGGPEFIFYQDVDIQAALTATSYGGIAEANLLDKSANETVTGNWTFGADLIVVDNSSPRVEAGTSSEKSWMNYAGFYNNRHSGYLQSTGRWYIQSTNDIYFRRQNDGANRLVLDTDTGNLTTYGEIIPSGGEQVISGDLTASTLKMGGDTVATQPWVTSELADKATIRARDTRAMPDSDGTPQYFPDPNDSLLDKSVNAIFSYDGWGGSSWGGALVVKGWSSGYAAWSIGGPASTSAPEEWYLRSGIGTTWNSHRRIWHDGNFDPSSKLDTSGGSLTGHLTVNGHINGSRVDANVFNTATAGVVTLAAGESWSVMSGNVTGERVWIGAEGGVRIVSSPNNWGSGWAGRNDLTLCDSAGESSFPGPIEIRNSTSSTYDVRLTSNHDYDGLFQVKDGGGTTRFTVGRDGNAHVGAPASGNAVLHYNQSGYNSGNIAVGKTAPSSPSQGDIWIDTN